MLLCEWLVMVVIIVILVLMVVVFVSLLIDCLLIDLCGFVDVMFEGLVIVSGDWIVEVNKCLCELLGVSVGVIMGSVFSDWFVVVEDIGEIWFKNIVEVCICVSVDFD